MSEIKHDLTLTAEEMRMIVKSYITSNADKDRSKLTEPERKLLTTLDKARDCGYFADENQRYGGNYNASWYEGRDPWPYKTPAPTVTPAATPDTKPVLTSFDAVDSTKKNAN